MLDCLGPMVLRQVYSQLVHWLELAKILLVYFRLALKGQIQVGERSLLVKAHWHFLHIRRHLLLVLILLAFGRGLAILLEMARVSLRVLIQMELGLVFLPAFDLRRLGLHHKRHFH